METEKLLVRIKPHNPKRGHVVKRYAYNGVHFLAARGWYKVDAGFAEELRDIKQIYGDEDSPLVFDVCTEAEAEAIDAREADASEVRRSAAKSTEIKTAASSAAPILVSSPDTGARTEERRGQRRGG